MKTGRSKSGVGAVERLKDLGRDTLITRCMAIERRIRELEAQCKALERKKADE